VIFICEHAERQSLLICQQPADGRTEGNYSKDISKFREKEHRQVFQNMLMGGDACV
jgi:hypothetical protein